MGSVGVSAMSSTPFGRHFAAYVRSVGRARPIPLRLPAPPGSVALPGLDRFRFASRPRAGPDVVGEAWFRGACGEPGGEPVGAAEPRESTRTLASGWFTGRGTAPAPPDAGAVPARRAARSPTPVSPAAGRADGRGATPAARERSATAGGRRPGGGAVGGKDGVIAVRLPSGLVSGVAVGGPAVRAAHARAACRKALPAACLPWPDVPPAPWVGRSSGTTLASANQASQPAS
ncbi:hypothetical protein Srubr_31540 [Streptomyces rubradiris]|uniref:Uncharacterized protein n=1 Tax=Streptomyces rubradiris TaxID=285531 RepID=A0ABQ3RBS7_STRRR|nr:hypothetical protein GCM10018792_00470 [Streptomyces rubradiris]GHI53308.1 hypothetical protein Srubr_31540 [Streptomyces rubradiris]